MALLRLAFETDKADTLPPRTRARARGTANFGNFRGGPGKPRTYVKSVNFPRGQILLRTLQRSRDGPLTMALLRLAEGRGS